MRNIGLIAVASLLTYGTAYPQGGRLFGKIEDGATHEALIGAHVIFDDGQGIVADLDGKYELTLPDENFHLVVFKYLGYESVKKRVKLAAGEELEFNPQLLSEAKDLDIVTVSASKYEKKLGEESVSMEVLTPAFIENTNSVTLDKALEKVPGVQMIGENISIRGGSSYSAGAGSRVLMLLDGIPLLTPHSSVVEFGSLPLESIKQVEVMKGASSALYGSSALNGIINVITDNPTEKPEYKFNLYYGLYENPLKGKKSKYYFSERPQTFSGTSFLFSQRVKRYDIVIDGAIGHDETHLFHNEKNRVRLNIKNRYRPKNMDNLTLGLNVNVAYLYGGFFFAWKDWGDTPLDSLDHPSFQPLKDSLAFTPSEVSDYRELPLNIDPYITYFDKQGNKHNIKGRWYYMMTRTGQSENTDASLVYGEYTFHSSLKRFGLDFVAGTAASFSYIDSEIFGQVKSKNAAVFLQIDKKFFNKLTITAGGRGELFKLDSVRVKIQPIGRIGINYQVYKASYLRASFGQGYRFPSIAEKFTKTVRAGNYVVPNQFLQPEKSWSAEIGFKQGFKLPNWMAYLDIAGFITQYYDMIEFTVAPDSVTKEYFSNAFFAFWAQNVTDARISGFDISAFGQGKIFGVTTNFLVGYTYLVPIDLNFDPNKSTNEFYDRHTNVLNYRYRHSAKADIESSYKGVTVGITGSINSDMEQIDDLIKNSPGVRDYWEQNKEAEFVLDARIAYNFTDNAKVALIGKNVLNNQYTNRPWYLEAPRNYTIQLAYAF